MKYFKNILISLFMLTIQTVLVAQTYYVAPNGDDNNPGTESAPWATIQKAASTLVAGETVYIKAGSYNEQVTVANSGTSNNYITFSAFPGDELQVVITSNSLPNNEFLIQGKSYIKVTGIRRDLGKRGFRVEGPSDGVILDGNYTYGTSSSGISVWGVPWLSDPGTYDNITNISVKNNIVEKACDGGGNECITFANGVKGFEIISNTVKNGGNPVNGGEGIDLKEGCSNGTIAYNEVYNLTRRAIYLDGGRNSGVTPWGKPIVENIEIYNNLIHDQQAGGGIAIMTEGPGDVRNVNIYNNIIYNNPSDGLMYYKHPYGTGVVHDITAINNTIYNNGRYGILSNFSTSYNMIIRNNISYNNVKKDIYLQSGGNISDHNLTGTDPLFVNASSGDFHIQTGSPAIDAGTSTGAPTLDYDGYLRTGTIDIGAFEYGAAPPPSDSISSASSPSSVNAGGSITVTVNYTTSTSRDIHVDFQNKDNWTNYGSSIQTVSATSSGSVNIPVNVDANAPIGTNYRFNIYITPVGADWHQTIGSTYRLEGISVTSSGPTTLFSDDFEDGDDNGWTVESGTWSVVSDGGSMRYQQGTYSTSERRTSAGSSVWSDFSFEVKVKPLSFVSSSGIYLYFRYTDHNNSYRVSISNGTTVKLVKRVNSKQTSLASTSYTFNTGTIYTIKAEANGTNLKVFIDGIEKLNVTDSDLSGGKIALATWKATGNFDDILVQDLSGGPKAAPINSDEFVAIIPAEFSLSQNYPNPFNPSTLINFKLNKDSHVTLTVFNILGEKVMDLVNEFRSAGNYTVNFNASELNSGIYFYRLSDGTKTLVRKMSLIK